MKRAETAEEKLERIKELLKEGKKVGDMPVYLFEKSAPDMNSALLPTSRWWQRMFFVIEMITLLIAIITGVCLFGEFRKDGRLYELLIPFTPYGLILILRISVTYIVLGGK